MPNQTHFFDSVTEIIENGIGLIGQALTLFYRFPQLIVPLAGSWFVYAGVVLGIRFNFMTFSQSFPGFLVQALLVYFFLTLTISMSSLVALEMLQQLELAGSTNLISAIRAAIRKNKLQVMLVALIWAVLWLVVSAVSAVVSVMTGRRSSLENPRSSEISFELAAKTLAGYEQGAGRENFAVSALQKALRLAVFLILPGIVWGNRDLIASTKHAFQIAHADWGKTATGFVASELIATVTSLPLALFFIAVQLFQWNVPEVVWMLVILYCAGAWSFTIFVEQIFAAELYLWHHHWTEASAARFARNEPAVPLQAFPRPALLETCVRLSPWSISPRLVRDKPGDFSGTETKRGN